MSQGDCLDRWVGAYELDPLEFWPLVDDVGAAHDGGMKSRTTSPGGQQDPVAESVAVYSGHAGAYAAAHAPKMADRVERFAGALPAPSLILDAGCGPGRDLARFRAHGHVVRGVDLNPVFVAMANAHAPTSECDLREVGSRFPAGTFDGIWASASLVHLDTEDVVDVLGQFAGLLRPRGRMYACLSATGRTGWLDEPDGRRWYTVWDPDEFAAAVAGTGFTIDEVDRGPYVEIWATRSD
ncbi:bifunctional 2-polyprenyl-6-hydroxyphenol methylase/3-demethylubiquinol 3-O-methyltransferase UbiG [Streptomyces sp. NBC_00083]|uniref:class I SAM-dependent methyltransferase n=1 Tax=Streptomyces sp. NBC_00083 TaxID=2975647 RepID=UPI00225230A1|nr:class I SAM-dependent methyltransferase [Streptomyces sp. NBC_00083]MCX5384790.1 class I SAM-dependent methyltransferase [Streptomyces sp. NBC_00083]